MGNFSQIGVAKDLINANGTNIYIYFATKSSANADFDPDTKNYQYINLPPKTIKGYVTQLTPEKLIWRQYGLIAMGAIEILCDSKYINWFKTCNRVTVNGTDYRVFKLGQGKLAIIQERAGGIAKIALEVM